MSRKREQVFHQFLRPLAGIGLPVKYEIPDAPTYESEIAFDRSKSKFLFSVEQDQGQENFEWVTISRARTVIKIDDDYTIDSDDYVILVDTSNKNVNIALPPALDCKQNEYNFKKIKSDNLINLIPASGETIDGMSGVSITKQYTNLTIVTDGNEWYII